MCIELRLKRDLILVSEVLFWCYTSRGSGVAEAEMSQRSIYSMFGVMMFLLPPLINTSFIVSALNLLMSSKLSGL